jgi:hypothetical protein
MIAESPMPRKMGRKKLWFDIMRANFPAGTFDRIAALLGEDEDRTDFVRLAVERECERREKTKPRRKGKP